MVGWSFKFFFTVNSLRRLQLQECRLNISLVISASQIVGLHHDNCVLTLKKSKDEKERVDLMKTQKRSCWI